MEKKEALATGVMVVNESNQVLLGKRIYNGTEMWSMPGGKKDAGESLVESAIRETKEECNLDIINLRQVVVSSHYNADKNIRFTMTGYVTRDYSNKVNNNEPHVFKEWRWFDLNNLPEVIFGPSRDILNQSGLI